MWDLVGTGMIYPGRDLEGHEIPKGLFQEEELDMVCVAFEDKFEISGGLGIFLRGAKQDGMAAAGELIWQWRCVNSGSYNSI
ncbi:hypothetical protein PAL_GLEAN10013537 [Pteropus alecto]|uniref:Uncharacterized protein n=1 Tax=Pteropus alecto TaxID=9402 RepID=L5JVZ9_PTEAL|nr:hypothetical protein PAL_GLEAN10013537 [Pteropus alecto]